MLCLVRRRMRPSFRTALLLVTGAAWLLACIIEEPAKKKKRTPIDPGDEYSDDTSGTEQPIEPAYVNPDSGAFGAPSRPSKADAGDRPPDGGSLGGGLTAKPLCKGPLVAGDLAIVEFLISSRTGSGDDGEWVEIQSTRSDCRLLLDGVTVESPRGLSAPNVAAIPAGTELPPLGTLVVADSADPAKNFGVAPVVTWNATDVLKNDGDTIAVKVGSLVIDSLTYPAFSGLEVGRSLSFPVDCTPPDRSSWERWSQSFHEHAPGQKGTPNEPNEDVGCF